MESFVYQSAPSCVVFGEDALQHLPEEVARLGAHRALVLTTPEQRELGERLAGLLGERAAGVYSQAVMHVPAEIAQAARAEAARLGPDCCVAVGGGSTIGLGQGHCAGIGAADLNQALGIPASLAAIGMPEAGLDEAATLACTNPYYNPRPIEREAILALLGRAWRGQAPA